MAMIVIYKCDKCGKEQDSGDQMWKAQVRVFWQGSSGDYESPKFEAMWCRSCTEEAGVLPGKRKPEELPKPMTLEDFIRDIVRQEIPQY